MSLHSRILCHGLLVLCALPCFASEEAPLNPDKAAYLEHKRSAVESGSEALRSDWLSPLNFSLSHTEQRRTDRTEFAGTDQAAVSLSQDLFRSGGIRYAIAYADDSRAYDLLALDEEEAQIREAIWLAVLGVRKYALECEQSRYRIANLKIAVFLKKTQYEAGDIDITELNDAIMEQNDEQANYLALVQALETERLELKKYTDRTAEAIALPTFTMVDEATYTAHRYTALLETKQGDVAYDTYRTTLGGYLPKLTLDASAAYTTYDDPQLTQSTGDSYSVGLSLSMPLKYGSGAAVEAQRALMLQHRSKAADARREAAADYHTGRLTIERYLGVNRVLETNLELYGELLSVTRKAYEAGYKTGYDLQTLENSIAADRLEIRINEINIQMELVKLHYAHRPEKG